VLRQMMENYKDKNSSILAIQKINKSESINYGVIETKDNNTNTNMKALTNIVEKPTPEKAPSNLAVVGRYIFSNNIFNFLINTAIGKGNEIQLTDAIKSMLSSNAVYAYEFEGKRFDCGDKLGFIKANIEYALKNKIFGDDLESYLKERLKI
jgi:UTP--glucose-1-phosphate uridylyltransferase